MPATALAQIEIRALRPLTGPNIWFNRQAWELRLACEGIDDAHLHPLADWLLDTLADAAGLPRFGTPPFPAVVPRVGDEARAANRPAFAAALMADLALALQVFADSPVVASALAPGDADDEWQIAVEFEEELLGRAAIETALAWIAAASRQEPVDWPGELERFRELATELRLGLATGSIVAAASVRGIPHMRLDAESLVQLGQGAKQRRIRMATTDGTGHVANFVAIDKDLTKRLLSRIGIPVPAGRPAMDADDACRAALEFGWPVVVKPQDADYGNGASIRLTTVEQVREAYSLARHWRERVLVERFVEGSMHRLLVVGGRLVAAVRFGPARVVGDGDHPIRELVAAANRDPRRGTGYPYPLRPIELGSEELAVLAEQGYTGESVLPVGTTVPLRRDVFLSRGGTVEDVTDCVHACVARAAIDAAQVVGLDVAGIDIIATDISRPLEEQAGAVLELNAEPSIAVHIAPLCNPHRPVADAIVEMLFPHGDDGRVPAIAVVGSGRRETAREIVRLCECCGTAAGYANNEGVWLSGRTLVDSPRNLRDAVQSLWLHARTAAAVVELSLEDIVASGLPFDRCDMLVITGLDGALAEGGASRFPVLPSPLAGEGSGMGGQASFDLNYNAGPDGAASPALHCLLSSLSSPRGLVLNLDDPAVAALAETVPPAAMLVSRDRQHPLLARHLHRGGCAVTCEQETFILHSGSSREPRNPVPCGCARDQACLNERSDAALLAWAASCARENCFRGAGDAQTRHR